MLGESIINAFAPSRRSPNAFIAICCVILSADSYTLKCSSTPHAFERIIHRKQHCEFHTLLSSWWKAFFIAPSRRLLRFYESFFLSFHSHNFQHINSIYEASERNWKEKLETKKKVFAVLWVAWRRISQLSPTRSDEWIYDFNSSLSLRSPLRAIKTNRQRMQRDASWNLQPRPGGRAKKRVFVVAAGTSQRQYPRRMFWQVFRRPGTANGQRAVCQGLAQWLRVFFFFFHFSIEKKHENIL